MAVMFVKNIQETGYFEGTSTGTYGERPYCCDVCS